MEGSVVYGGECCIGRGMLYRKGSVVYGGECFIGIGVLYMEGIVVKGGILYIEGVFYKERIVV